MLIPFRLSPIYKDYIWGGKRLRPEAEITAEAWIICEEDVVLDGTYKGQTLANVCKLEGAALMGTRVFGQSGSRFPLLIKLLDCANWLSLQVHPDNEQAAKLAGADQSGKTEAWFVINAENDARLISGFKSAVTFEDIQKAVGKKEILDLVERRSVKTGDTIFIAPGTLHALGPGLLIYELQQNSDITYRVYDWDRPLEGGRKLHVTESVEVLNPAEKGEIMSASQRKASIPRQVLASCEFFTLELLQGNQTDIKINTAGESFSVITAPYAAITITGKDWTYQLNTLESLFIPAECHPYKVEFTVETNALLAYC